MLRQKNSALHSVCGLGDFLPWRYHGGHALRARLDGGSGRANTTNTGRDCGLTPTFGYNPAVIDEEFATTALLTEDRVVLGVGAGETQRSRGMQGEWPAFKERFARLREAIRLIRELWTSDSVDHTVMESATPWATRRSMIDVRSRFRSTSQPQGPVVAKCAGRVGAGFIWTSGKGMESANCTPISSCQP